MSILVPVRKVIMKRLFALLSSILIAAALAVVVTQGLASGAPCDRNATPSTFASEVSAATAGQTICLAAGSYGTFSGTNKAVTIRSATGQTASMALNLGSGDSSFTLDSVTVTQGDINNGANSIVIRNSLLSTVNRIDFQVANSNILVEYNTFAPLSGAVSDARLYISEITNTTQSGVTISHNLFAGGGSDGMQVYEGVTVTDNEFRNICADGSGNHTDHFQAVFNPSGVVFQRNYVHSTCNTQFVAAFDAIQNAVITDNIIVGATRPWGLEMFVDTNSLVAHNTIIGPQTQCDYGMPCGLMSFQYNGRGTRVIDNIAAGLDVGNGSSLGGRHHNMLSVSPGPNDFKGTPVFVGGALPTSYAGFCLAAGSPGKGAASDGLDVGIRCTTPPPTTTTTTPPTTTTTTITTTTTTEPPPNPTTAVYTFTPANPVTGQSVTFDASTSNCAVAPCTYQWEDDGPDGPGGTQWPLGEGQILTRSFVNAGDKMVRLHVTDAASGTATIMHVITVSEPSPPTPTPPTCITATAGAASRSVVLDWDDAVWAAGSTNRRYEVHEDLFNGFDNLVRTVTVSNRTSGALAAGTYRYYVIAKDSTGTIGSSPKVTVTVPVSGTVSSPVGCTP